MPPAARVTDMHVCPMVTPGVPPIPHVGGPILPPGVPTVLIDFLPAATVTDMAMCVGPPDVIVMGSTGVFINFLPAARLGDSTAHGGAIVMGSPTCIIGEVGSPSPGTVGLGGIVAGLLSSLGLDQALASVYAKGSALVNSWLIKKVGQYGKGLVGSQYVQDKLAASKPTGIQQVFDGDVIGAGCTPSGRASVTTAKGIRPTKCSDPTKKLPKVYFANGIRTDLYGKNAPMCSTMQQIADQTCAEVVGIYGASGSMSSDLSQAMQTIKKTAYSPQVETLTSLLLDSMEADPPTAITIIAHSRGGLATQQAVGKAKKLLRADMPSDQVKQKLSNVSVNGYGTVTNGWTEGPYYSIVNNTYDPVPPTIKAAQEAFPQTDAQGVISITPDVRNDPKFLSDAHSLSDEYVGYMGKAPGLRDCDCS